MACGLQASLGIAQPQLALQKSSCEETERPWWGITLTLGICFHIRACTRHIPAWPQPIPIPTEVPDTGAAPVPTACPAPGYGIGCLGLALMDPAESPIASQELWQTLSPTREDSGYAITLHTYICDPVHLHKGHSPQTKCLQPTYALQQFSPMIKSTAQKPRGSWGWQSQSRGLVGMACITQGQPAKWLQPLRFPVMFFSFCLLLWLDLPCL